MLALCMADPKAGREYMERLGPEHFTSPILAQVSSGCASIWRTRWTA